MTIATACDLEITLPWPPSANNYWRHVGHKVLISAKGQKFRSDVCTLIKIIALSDRAAWKVMPFVGPIAVVIEAHPPDRIRRDIDNLFKSLLDSMQHAGVYGDDNQIADLSISRRDVAPGGKVVVRIRRMV